MQAYWDEIVSIWPELESYHDQIDVIYAGLNPDNSILNQLDSDITSDILSALEADKRIFFYGVEEGFIKPVLYKIQAIVENIEFQPHSIVFSTSAVNGAEIYQQLLIAEGWKKPMTIVSGHYFERTNFHTSLMNIPEYNVKTKEKLFTCFNRVPRSHRAKLLAKMFEYKLVDQAYYSFEGSFSSTKLPIWATEHFILRRYKNLLPLRLDINEDTDNPSKFNDQDLQYHLNSYFSLVTETGFYFTSLAQSSIFISEKTFRPICYKHPFIIVSRPGTLSALRDAGYKTFSPWINEEYDNIINDDDRLLAIVKEVNILAKFTDADWLVWQEKVKPIVEHNYRVFRDKTDYSITKDLHYLLNLA